MVILCYGAVIIRPETEWFLCDNLHSSWCILLSFELNDPLLFVHGEFILYLILMSFFFNEFPRIVPFRYIILIFYPILMHFKLRALIVSLLVSCISYSFRDKVNRNRPTKAKFQNLNFLIFHPILMHFLQNDHLDGLLMEHFYFISNRGLKWT